MYMVRLALSSCHFRTSEVKLETAGPGTLKRGDATRMTMWTRSSSAAAPARTTGERSNMMMLLGQYVVLVATVCNGRQ